ncbi:sarcosine oxidase subunit alpha family protein [Salinisphaera aquimarina]|uniref:Sarcosine oxidase subunit alpha family protein n=1 Tax=Salinisphaera aquimarina TaxID=2094031 RepID=A0ABV7EUC1_9GAMM
MTGNPRPTHADRDDRAPDGAPAAAPPAGQPYRLAEGGLIDRSRPLRFIFNGRTYQGYAGDTLASALLANGVRRVARSFKYHRPRGVFATGAAEPNAMVRLETGARAEPNRRATRIALYDGLTAASQNCWPSVDFDVGAINDGLRALLSAGFYYKTFMWPARWWPAYERGIRRAAGMGEAPDRPDPDQYEHRFAHCDVLVVGGGATGLTAAVAAGRAGADVILVHDGAQCGGGLRARAASIGEHSPAQWIDARLAELAALANVTLITRASAAGYYDGNLLTVVQTLFEGTEIEAPAGPRQRLWKIRAAQVVLATGAIERPLVFADNDRPGVMLASAARRYANQFAVAVGRQVVIAGNNDSAFEAALDLHRAGVRVSAVLDSRAAADSSAQQRVHAAGIRCLYEHQPLRTRGRRAVRGLDVVAADGRVTPLACDSVATAGGWNPTVHLFSQSQGTIVFDERLQAFLPGHPAQATRCAGALNGHHALAVCVDEGWRIGREAADRCGFTTPADEPPSTELEPQAAPLQALWAVARPAKGHGKRFVDLQNDVGADDIALAVREGYHSVEHVKRYTTLGMGTDQGRTSNVNGLAILAGLLDKPIPEVGTTTFRAPYTAVTLGTLAGHRRGAPFRPWRRTPLDACHEAAGAQFVNVGPWRRPLYYPRPGETATAAIRREANTVRRAVGMVDVSTLGRIEIQGADAAAFLDAIYVNRVSKLVVGKSTYALMLRTDGCVFDDGTVARLAADHFQITTTTAHATEVFAHLAYHQQRHHMQQQVFIASVTDAWAVVALAGPRARDVLTRLDVDTAVDNDSLAFMHLRDVTLGDELPARVFRNSYSGELAFEIAVAADRGPELWQRLLAAGEAFGLCPYGTEAMSALRIEKGHVAVGAEIDGRTTADDLGLGGLLRRKADFSGRRALDTLSALQASGRKQLVGLSADMAQGRIPVGAQLVADPDHPMPNPILGHVTSACVSSELGHPIALALLADGRARHGEQLFALAPLTGECVRVSVKAPVFIDPDGERLRQ